MTSTLHTCTLAEKTSPKLHTFFLSQARESQLAQRMNRHWLSDKILSATCRPKNLACKNEELVVVFVFLSWIHAPLRARGAASSLFQGWRGFRATFRQLEAHGKEVLAEVLRRQTLGAEVCWVVWAWPL